MHSLAHEWRKLARLATSVGLLTSPILYAAIAGVLLAVDGVLDV